MPVRHIRLHCVAALISLSASPAVAQTSDAPLTTNDRVRVLGSYLNAHASTEEITQSDLRRLGLEDLTLALTRLPANIGAEFNTDSGTQNDTSGTANINLRGLGLDATLVLLDARRMTVSSVAADDGSSFVDLNTLAPANAIESVNVFADGASALYGSDALAGVVNVTTRAGFEGLELTAERRVATEYGDDASDWIVQAIAGRAGGDWSVTGAVSWLDRQSLEGTDTSFTPGTGVSSLGQPGAFLVPTETGSTIIIDPDCAAAGGIPLPNGDPIEGLGTPGFCGLDFAQFFSVVNNEQRLQAWFDAQRTFGGVRARAQITFADNAIERGNSPSLPDLSFPTITSANPGNVFGADVSFFGRPRGVQAGSARRTFDHVAYRVLGELEGDLAMADREWTWTTALTYSRNDVRTTITDTLRDRFDAALLGFGGPDCPGPENGATPGDNAAGCYYVNPFGSGVLVTDPADPRFNNPIVLDDILGLDVRNSDTDLITADALITTDALAQGPAGAIAAAFGVQLRRETTATDHGEDFNAENFLFILGGPDFDGERNAAAAFAELDVPLTSNLTLQAASRYEDVDGEDALSPRIALTWTNRHWTLSATASQAFRAPSLNETVSAATTLESLPVNGQNLFRAVTTFGSDSLKPETANTLTARLGFNAGPWRGAMTVWRYDVEDLIVEESAQAIIAADLEDGSFDDPRIELSQTGDVVRVNAAFVNAPEVQTSGIDLAAGFDADLWNGRLALDASSTYIAEYTLTDPVTNEEVSAEGRRNATSFARSLPQWRTNAAANWTRGPHALAVSITHISSYEDDENPGANVDAHTTLDAQYALTLRTLGGQSQVTLGVINATDEPPPFVATPLGYDTKVHDPRGRIAYLRLTQSF